MFHWHLYYPRVQESPLWMTGVKGVFVHPRLGTGPANELKSRKDQDSDLPANATNASHGSVVSHHRSGPV